MAVHGGPEIQRRMRIIVRNVRKAVAVALDDAADDLLARAQQLAPQLEGDLIESGIIKKRGSLDVLRRWVVFTACHAVRRHEDFYSLGPISALKSSPDGPIGRKYLSRPFWLHKDRYHKEIERAMSGALRQSVR